VAAGGDCYVLSPACRESANDSKCGTLAASASALAAAVTSAFFFVTRTDTDKDLKGTLHQSLYWAGAGRVLERRGSAVVNLL
jgi:hypothetical protein